MLLLLLLVVVVLLLLLVLLLVVLVAVVVVQGMGYRDARLHLGRQLDAEPTRWPNRSPDVALLLYRSPCCAFCLISTHSKRLHRAHSCRKMSTIWPRPLARSASALCARGSQLQPVTRSRWLRTF